MSQESKNWISDQELDHVCRQFFIMYNQRSKLSVKQMSIPPEDLTMAFRTISSCALRPKELFFLKVSDFDFDNLILSLPVTKTGFKQCKCSIWKVPQQGKKKVLIECDKKCQLCKGTGKIRKVQFTTIAKRRDADDLQKYFKEKKLEAEDLPFPYYQQILRKYFKEAGELAGLKIFTAKENTMIYNAYPYILRESRAKIMEDLGAKDSLIKLKLRHSRSSDVTLRYKMGDLNTLKVWEAEHYK